MSTPTKPAVTSSTSSRPTTTGTQRTLVYALTGFMCLTGLLLAMAFKDPCPPATLKLIARCTPTIGDRIPSGLAFLAAGAIMLAMIGFYELRRYTRVYGVGAAGVALMVIGGLALLDGMSPVLVVMCQLVGGGLIAAAWGIARDHRAAWAFAAATCGTLGIVTFFAASSIGGVGGWPLALALMPSLAVLLPLTVAVGSTPPGWDARPDAPPTR